MKPLTLVVPAVLASPAMATTTPEFIPFGDLAGGIVQSQALAASADGEVVTGWSSGATDLAVRRTLPSPMVAVSPPPASIVALVANGVSADGTAIVGQASVGGLSRAFYWSQAGGILNAGSLSGSPDSSVAYAISGDGRVLVGHSRSPNTVVSGTNEAFRWSPGTGIAALGDLELGVFNSRALAASFDGRTIVGFATSGQGQEACRWRFPGGLQGLGNFPSTLFSSQARDVSEDGSVIVGFGHDTTGKMAFRWTEATGLTALGELPGGLYDSYANGVSGDGNVIVGRSMTASGDRAFLWTESTGIQELGPWLSATHGLATTGWTLREAHAISADGATIVGFGLNPQGRTEGWIVRLPNAPIAGTIQVPGFGGDLSTLRTFVELRAAGNGALLSRRRVKPDAQGRWRLTTTVQGAVDIFVRVGSSLFRGAFGLNLTPAGLSGLVFPLVLADIVPNNVVDLDDFLALAATYELPSSDPAFNVDADLDGDGAVDLDDFLILASEYGRQGDGPAG